MHAGVWASCCNALFAAWLGTYGNRPGRWLCGFSFGSVGNQIRKGHSTGTSAILVI